MTAVPKHHGAGAAAIRAAAARPASVLAALLLALTSVGVDTRPAAAQSPEQQVYLGVRNLDIRDWGGTIPTLGEISSDGSGLPFGGPGATGRTRSGDTWDNTPLSIDTLDLDPTADGEFLVHTGFTDDGLALHVIDRCDQGGGLFALGQAEGPGAAEIDFFQVPGGSGQTIRIAGTDEASSAPSRPNTSVVQLECQASDADGKLLAVGGQGIWRGRTNYQARVDFPGGTSSAGYQTFVIRGDQYARDLGTDRTAFIYDAFGYTEASIPVRVKHLSGKDKIVVEMLVMAASGGRAPSLKQIRRSVAGMDDVGLTEIYDKVARNKAPKGRDRLSFRQGADYWALQISLKDNAKSRGLVNELFGHPVLEVPAVGDGLGPVSLQVDTDGVLVDLPLVSQMDLGPVPSGSTLSLYQPSTASDGPSVVVVWGLRDPGESPTADYEETRQEYRRAVDEIEAAEAELEEVTDRFHEAVDLGETSLDFPDPLVEAALVRLDYAQKAHAKAQVAYLPASAAQLADATRLFSGSTVVPPVDLDLDLDGDASPQAGADQPPLVFSIDPSNTNPFVLFVP